MISKEYYCDNTEGCIQIRFSKQEMGRKNIVAECDYIKSQKDIYDVTIYVGILEYEKLEEYKALQFNCKRQNLKQVIVAYFKENLNQKAVAEILEIIDKKVKPTYIQSIDKIGEVVQCIGLNKKTYLICVLPDKTSIFLEGCRIKTVEKQLDYQEIAEIISGLVFNKNSSVLDSKE